MALSIRNPLAERLARDVARETGETITQAVIGALEERLTRLSGRRTVVDLEREIMRIGMRCGSLPDLDRRHADEILSYGDEKVPEGS